MPGPGVLPIGCDRWHHLRVDTDWDHLVSVCQQALGDLVEGRPEPFKALWSHPEHMTRRVGDRTQSRTLRCTQAYRRENGGWKVVLRHADELSGKDEQRR